MNISKLTIIERIADLDREDYLLDKKSEFAVSRQRVKETEVYSFKQVYEKRQGSKEYCKRKGLGYDKYLNEFYQN